MRDMIQRSVEAAQRDGDLPADASPKDIALLIMSAAWGIHVMAEAGVPKEALVNAGGQLFAMSRIPA